MKKRWIALAMSAMMFSAAVTAGCGGRSREA